MPPPPLRVTLQLPRILDRRAHAIECFQTPEGWYGAVRADGEREIATGLVGALDDAVDERQTDLFVNLECIGDVSRMRPLVRQQAAPTRMRPAGTVEIQQVLARGLTSIACPAPAPKWGSVACACGVLIDRWVDHRQTNRITDQHDLAVYTVTDGGNAAPTSMASRTHCDDVSDRVVTRRLSVTSCSETSMTQPPSNGVPNGRRDMSRYTTRAYIVSHENSEDSRRCYLDLFDMLDTDVSIPLL